MTQPAYNRLFVKMVRDKTRVKLESSGICYVSGVTEGVEIHHMHTLSALVNKYLTVNDIDLNKCDKVKVRQDFIDSHQEEIQDQVVLHKDIHKKLHIIFGLKYPEHLVPKVRRWLEKQKAKYE